MDKVEGVEICCLHCETWFKSPIAFGTLKSFYTSNLIGNTVRCPHCGQMTGCNKENVRLWSQDEGFVGKDT